MDNVISRQNHINGLQNGKFKTGFWGGAIGSAVASSGLTGDTSNREWNAIAKRTAIAATAGGITAELGGGKFSNGARSSAFVSLYNHYGQPDYGPSEHGPDYHTHGNGDNYGEYFIDAPLGSSTPILDVFGGGKIAGFAVKTPAGRVLCASVALCVSAPVIDNARNIAEDYLKRKDIYRVVNDSINAYKRSKK